MHCISMVIIMWDPEYCDSELRAVEASVESRDELRPCQQTQLKINRRLTGGTHVTSACMAVAQQHQGQEKLLGLPINYACLHPDLRCLAKFLSLAVLSIQLVTSNFQLHHTP